MTPSLICIVKSKGCHSKSCDITTIITPQRKRELNMSTMEKKEKNGVAKIRERFFERLKNWKPSPELEEVIKQKSPEPKKDDVNLPEKKIARPSRENEADL